MTPPRAAGDTRSDPATPAGPGWRLLCSVALMALLLGLWVYLVERRGHGAMLIPHAAVDAAAPLPALLGASATWLPSLLHPLAFSLLTALALARRGRDTWAGCAAWWLLNVLAESLQHPALAALALHAMDAAPAAAPMLQPLRSFIEQGRFDGADLLAATAGSGLALALLHGHARTGEPP